MRFALFLCFLPLFACTSEPSESQPEDETSYGTTSGTVTDTANDTGTLAVTTDTGTPTTDTALAPNYELEVLLTADDAWQLWIDGTPIDQQEGWSFSNTNASILNLNTDGPHVVAVHGYDTANVIAGFMAEVKLDGAVIGLTGDGSWVVAPHEPHSNWMDINYDDSWFVSPLLCDPNDVSLYWDDRPTDLTSTGALWIWNQPCRNLGDAWFRLDFWITPP